MFCSTDPIGSLWDDTWLFSVLFSPLLCLMAGWSELVKNARHVSWQQGGPARTLLRCHHIRLSAPANCLPGHWHTNLICYLGRLQNLSSILSLSLIEKKYPIYIYSSEWFCAVKYNKTQK